MADIRVSSRNIELISNEKCRQYDMYKVTMPKGGEYEGYHFLISPNNFCDMKRMKSPQYIFSVSNNYIFELIKSEREPGKRYTRPKVSVNEILREFTLGADKCGKMWLANVTSYMDKGRNNVHFLSLGIKADKWFYPVDDTTLEVTGMRKLTNSYGLVLIKEMDEGEIARYQKYLAANENSYFLLEGCKSRKRNFDYYLKGSNKEDSAEIATAERALSDILAQNIETAKKQRLETLSEFADFISYTEKQWNEEKQNTNKMTEEMENAR